MGRTVIKVSMWSTPANMVGPVVCSLFFQLLHHRSLLSPVEAGWWKQLQCLVWSRDEVGGVCWRTPPLTLLPTSCPQSKSRSQSHADVQLRLSRSSQVWAKKKLSPAAAFTSGMRRSWELLLPGASAHCGGRHWCDPNRAVCHRPTHGSTDQWLVNHRTQ